MTDDNPTLKEYEALLERVQLLEAQVQASVNLTDDLVNQANTVVTAVGDRAAESIQTAENMLAGMDSMIAIYLGLIALFSVCGACIIAWIQGTQRNKLVAEAVGEFKQKISEDSVFQREFGHQVATNERVREILLTIMETAAENVFVIKGWEQKDKKSNDELAGSIDDGK